MNTSLLVTIVAIEGAGLLITIGFGIAIFRAARQAKKKAEAAKKTASDLLFETRRFVGNIEAILGK